MHNNLAPGVITSLKGDEGETEYIKRNKKETSVSL